MELSMLRMQDAIDYLQQSYKAYAERDDAAAKDYLARSLAMERRARRHWQVSRHGVKR